MKIKQSKAVRVQIPLRVKFSQSNNATKFSDSIILELITANEISGYGESCPRLYVTGEDWKSVYKDFQLTDRLLKDQEFESVETIRDFVLNELYPKIGPASLCAIELALLDAFGKETRCSIKNYFGLGDHPDFQYSGVIPLMEISILETFLEKQLNRFSFSALKLKVGTNLAENLAKIDLIRSVLGTRAKVRIDANCSWTLAEAENQIPAYLDKGIDSFEQIFPKGSESDMGRINKKFGAVSRIMADESSTTFESVRYLIENELCNFFNFKISKNGGIFNSLRIYDYITENGAGCQLGAHFGETSILTVAGAFFAAQAPRIANFEGGLGDYLLETDICRPSIKIERNGSIGEALRQLRPFGLGLEVDHDLLFKYSL